VMEWVVWIVYRSCCSIMLVIAVAFDLSAFSQAKSDFIYLVRRPDRRCPFQADYALGSPF